MVKREGFAMKLSVFVPGFLKPVLRPIYYAFKKLTHKPKSRQELYEYWREPWDDLNVPELYLEGEARSKFLVEIVKRHVKPSGEILEIGCNVGRNLNYLFLNHFRKLAGIEISQNAVKLLKESFPEMASQIRIYNAPVEEIIGQIEDNAFDVVFTMAVLEHIHTSSEWIFSEVVRVARDLLITVEDEKSLSWRHFPRNYKEIFQPLGMTQIEVINCDSVDKLGSNFIARVFKKKLDVRTHGTLNL